MFVFVLLGITLHPFWFAVVLGRRRGLVALLLLTCGCVVAVGVLWLFLTVPWVGLLCVVLVFPDHSHLHFNNHFFLF